MNSGKGGIPYDFLLKRVLHSRRLMGKFIQLAQEVGDLTVRVTGCLLLYVLDGGEVSRAVILAMFHLLNDRAWQGCDERMRARLEPHLEVWRQTAGKLEDAGYAAIDRSVEYQVDLVVSELEEHLREFPRRLDAYIEGRGGLPLSDPVLGEFKRTVARGQSIAFHRPEFRRLMRLKDEVQELRLRMAPTDAERSPLAFVQPMMRLARLYEDHRLPTFEPLPRRFTDLASSKSFITPFVPVDTTVLCERVLEVEFAGEPVDKHTVQMLWGSVLRINALPYFHNFLITNGYDAFICAPDADVTHQLRALSEVFDLYAYE